MKIFSHEEVEAVEAEEGASRLRVRWLITREMGAENFAMRLFEMEPGGNSPLHQHPWEHEVYIVEGRGVVASQEGEKQFMRGDVIFIFPNEVHQFRNVGEKTVKFLCIVPHHQ